jgi:hypothetical protein
VSELGVRMCPQCSEKENKWQTIGSVDSRPVRLPLASRAIASIEKHFHLRSCGHRVSSLFIPTHPSEWVISRNTKLTEPINSGINANLNVDTTDIYHAKGKVAR